VKSLAVFLGLMVTGCMVVMLYLWSGESLIVLTFALLTVLIVLWLIQRRPWASDDSPSGSDDKRSPKERSVKENEHADDETSSKDPNPSKSAGSRSLRLPDVEVVGSKSVESQSLESQSRDSGGSLADPNRSAMPWGHSALTTAEAPRPTTQLRRRPPPKAHVSGTRILRQKHLLPKSHSMTNHSKTNFSKNRHLINHHPKTDFSKSHQSKTRNRSL